MREKLALCIQDHNRKYGHFEVDSWDKFTVKQILKLFRERVKMSKSDIEAGMDIIKLGVKARKKPCKCSEDGLCWRCAKMLLGESVKSKMKATKELLEQLKEEM